MQGRQSRFIPMAPQSPRGAALRRAPSGASKPFGCEAIYDSVFKDRGGSNPLIAAIRVSRIPEHPCTSTAAASAGCRPARCGGRHLYLRSLSSSTPFLRPLRCCAFDRRSGERLSAREAVSMSGPPDRQALCTGRAFPRTLLGKPHASRPLSARFAAVLPGARAAERGIPGACARSSPPRLGGSSRTPRPHTGRALTASASFLPPPSPAPTPRAGRRPPVPPRIRTARSAPTPRRARG